MFDNWYSINRILWMDGIFNILTIGCKHNIFSLFERVTNIPVVI